MAGALLIETVVFDNDWIDGQYKRCLHKSSESDALKCAAHERQLGTAELGLADCEPGG